MFSGDVMTDRPSIPIFSSTYSMPASEQVAASSSSIAREAVAMSLPSSQKRAKPSPVPGPSTSNVTPSFAAAKSSRAIDTIGSTVDEPMATISPSAEPVWLPSGLADRWQHAASTSIDPTLTTSRDRHHLRVTFSPSSGVRDVERRHTPAARLVARREDVGRRLTNPYRHVKSGLRRRQSSRSGSQERNGLRTRYARAAAVPEAGSVRNQAVTIERATDHRTCLSRLDEPTPMIDEVMTCVVLTGTPI